MKKQLSIVFLALVGAGVGLTVNRPTEEKQTAPTYMIDRASMEKPLPTDSTLLKVSAMGDEQIGLQIGLFSELHQAKQQIETLGLLDTLQIITTQDQHQRWHRVMAGPFATTTEASNMQKRLNAKYLVQSSWVKWPLEASTEGA